MEKDFADDSFMELTDTQLIRRNRRKHEVFAYAKTRSEQRFASCCRQYFVRSSVLNHTAMVPRAPETRTPFHPPSS